MKSFTKSYEIVILIGITYLYWSTYFVLQKGYNVPFLLQNAKNAAKVEKGTWPEVGLNFTVEGNL